VFPHADKLVHLGLFFVHGFFVYGTFFFSAPRQTKKNIFPYVLSACFLFGLILELLQTFVPGRSTDLWDIIFNTGGATLGIIGFLLIIKNKLQV
ncbi:MAG: VanZ family protein, partial [Cyclobacteriaceae bacterium]|nr:VanZ family protein [Cyclobacteriaceae bacterium]